jgi:ACS family D-galactonate transporter-like MFS transporter
MNWVALGYSTSLPFVAGAIGVLLGGFVSDMLLRRTESATLARKVPMVAGFLLAATIGLASVVGSDAAVIAIMSLAFFGQGMLGLGWTVITDVAPKNGIGLASGVFNLTSNLGGIITPLLIGVVLSRTGSFTLGLAFISVMSILGAAAYLWILGPVERVDID